MVDPLSMYKSGAPIISVDGSVVAIAMKAQQQASIQSDTVARSHAHRIEITSTWEEKREEQNQTQMRTRNWKIF